MGGMGKGAETEMGLAVWFGDQRFLLGCLALDLAPAWPAAAFKGVFGDWVLLYTGILQGLGGAWFGLVIGAGTGFGHGPCASIIDFKGGVVRSLPWFEIPLCLVLFTPSSVLCSIFWAVSQSRH